MDAERNAARLEALGPLRKAALRRRQRARPSVTRTLARHTASLLQVAGAVCFVAVGFLLSTTVGLGVLGLVLLAAGLVLERPVRPKGGSRCAP